MLVTGYWGQGNDADIAATAVAARATVNQMIRVALQPARGGGTRHGPGGILIFAQCAQAKLAKTIVQEDSAMEAVHKIGSDFADYFYAANPMPMLLVPNNGKV